MTKITRLLLISLVPLLAACGGDGSGSGGSDALADVGATDVPPAEQAVDSSARTPSPFQATIGGALNQTVRGNTAVSGAEFGRYHINLAAQAQPVVLIALARTDTTTPVPGSYALGGDAFDGTLEIYGDPQRDFVIVAGELEILGAKGDTLAGRFSFIAHELGQGGASQGGEIQVDGTFRTTGSGRK
ncbi:MAG: hypothetical protein ACYC2G_10650 [Gemmatimonadaceae bacterium]